GDRGLQLRNETRDQAWISTLGDRGLQLGNETGALAWISTLGDRCRLFTILLQSLQKLMTSGKAGSEKMIL
ncbi:hypothetical protein P0Y35_08495, partial [Kiritimatiellaeota bacterium B1221]|nr:hypothetical protein [Kiritimatiellaeota bacterium B1221]